MALMPVGDGEYKGGHSKPAGRQTLSGKQRVNTAHTHTRGALYFSFSTSTPKSGELFSLFPSETLITTARFAFVVCQCFGCVRV